MEPASKTVKAKVTKLSGMIREESRLKAVGEKVFKAGKSAGSKCQSSQCEPLSWRLNGASDGSFSRWEVFGQTEDR